MTNMVNMTIRVACVILVSKLSVHSFFDTGILTEALKWNKYGRH